MRSLQLHNTSLRYVDMHFYTNLSFTGHRCYIMQLLTFYIQKPYTNILFFSIFNTYLAKAHPILLTMLAKYYEIYAKKKTITKINKQNQPSSSIFNLSFQYTGFHNPAKCHHKINTKLLLLFQIIVFDPRITPIANTHNRSTRGPNPINRRRLRHRPRPTPVPTKGHTEPWVNSPPHRACELLDQAKCCGDDKHGVVEEDDVELA